MIDEGYMDLENEKQYWTLVEKQWPNIISLALGVMDLKSPAFDPPGQATGVLTGRNCLDEMVHLKESRNGDLVRYFFAIWSLTSDRVAASRPPGWSSLCDLVSEEWVLN